MAHEYLGGGAAGTVGGAVRSLGGGISNAWLGYGNFMAGAELYCSFSCVGAGN